MEDLKIKLQNLQIEHNITNVILEATVPTGLESTAAKDIVNNININEKDICFVPGRLYFTIPIDVFPKVLTLRSLDNIHLFVYLIPNLKFQGEKVQDLEEIVFILDEIDLCAAVQKWKLISKYCGNISPSREQHDEARTKQDKIFSMKREQPDYIVEDDAMKHNVLKYRVTCDRIGEKHSFNSNEAAYRFGGEINNKYHWIVALSDWDLNIMLRIQDNAAMVCLKITPKSLHRRCLIAFGPTSLRPTIAYGMLQLADPRPGEHILDPLCGGGSIPIECMHGFPQVLVSCGDLHEKAVDRTMCNVQAQATHLRSPDVFFWDATRLPFADHQIDVIVTDLPFGKRSGSRGNNAHFYKKLIAEFARVLCTENGRLVLLSHDSPHLYKALQYREAKSCWFITRILSVNVGALKCSLIVARRKKTDQDTAISIDQGN